MYLEGSAAYVSHTSNVTYFPDHISITLQQYKTDPFRHGCAVKICSTTSSTCPHHAFDRYRKCLGAGVRTEPLFKAGKFQPLSHAAVTRTLRIILCQASLNDLLMRRIVFGLVQPLLQLLLAFLHGSLNSWGAGQAMHT